jgi:hypothetical protein
VNDTKTKRYISGLHQIEAALAVDTVYCTIPSLDPKREFIVRDVDKEWDTIKVLVLEGWRTPGEVWTTRTLDEGGTYTAAELETR